MARIASIDYGLARLGVAVSDERKIISASHFVVPAGKTAKESAKKIVESLKTYQIETIIVGMPLHLDGNKGFLADEVLHFVELLKQEISVTIILWDERLTTKLAEKSLREGNLSRKKRAQLVDAISASLLLQNYLDSICVG